MSKIKYLYIYLSAIVIWLSISNLLGAQANISTSDNEINTIKFVPPEDGEKPETKGAGTRNPDRLKCAPNDSEALAMMPQDNYGLTIQKRPEIFVYLPNTSAERVVISFESSDRKHHELAFLPIDKARSIVSFALPENKPELNIEEYYQWKITLVCGDIPNVDDPILSGWIKRKEQDITMSNSINKDKIQQAKWYGDNGYWYDMLKEVVQISNLKDTCIVDFWHNLIK